MTEAFVFDAWALMAFLQGEQPAARRLRELLLAEENACRLYISVINLGEVYYRVGKTQGEKIAEEALAKLRLLPLEILPADDKAVWSAARLKMRNRISYADAFALTAAQDRHATLLTGDPELTALKGQWKIETLRRGE